MIPPRAFVLAAGFGTRLKPLSDELPKPGWPLFDRPIAAHVLHALAAVGVAEVVVNLHHKAEQLKAALVPHLPGELTIQWSREEEILGTGGALRPWAKWLGRSSALVLNGDTYLEMDLVAFCAFHQRQGGAATLALHPLPEGSEGPIEVDDEGRIVRFLDARAPGKAPGRPCDFAGVHLLEPEATGELSKIDQANFCINARIHTLLVMSSVPLYGFLLPQETYWSDLGTPRRYLDSHHALLTREQGPPVSLGRWVTVDGVAEGGGRVIAPCYLGPKTRVERGAVVGPHAVLCEGVTVQSQGRVEASVVWPDAQVGETIRHSVVSPSGLALNSEGKARSLAGRKERSKE